MRGSNLSFILCVGVFLRTGQWISKEIQQTQDLLGVMKNGLQWMEQDEVGFQNAAADSEFSRYSEMEVNHTAKSRHYLMPPLESNDNRMTFQEPLLQTDNIAVAMISMGKATQQNHVQRAVRSLRARGEWKGRIVIVTDNSSAYRELMDKDPWITCIPPRQEDMELQYEEVALKYKRFKTLLGDYIKEYRQVNDQSDNNIPAMPTNSFQEVTHILYMDVDIVVCQPLLPWIQYKWMLGEEKRQSLNATMSTVYMFQEGPNTGKVAHGGLILQHVNLSKHCMEEWRRRMDEARQGRDQALLRAMMQKGSTKTGCKIQTWKRKELIFPFPEDFEQMRMKQFVHITNTYHSKRTNSSLQQAFLEEALNLTEIERRDPNSLAIVPPGF